MNKKAQAAMEFLVTYGWAILVVIVVIAALAFSGILNNATMTPERCLGPAGLECAERASLIGNTLVWSTKNNQGHDITITGIEHPASGSYCTLLENGTWSVDAGPYVDTDTPVPNKSFIAFKVDCRNTKPTRVHAEVIVKYTSDLSGLEHEARYKMDVRKH